MKIEKPKATQEIYEIRRKMYEETKNMTPRELIACYKKLAAEFEKESVAAFSMRELLPI